MSELTLVMPCYNRALDLKRVLQAYDRQMADTRFEILAVDDGSTDSTYEVLCSYRPQRYSLRVEQMEVNGGPSRARNRAIPLITTPLMMFVGDDMLPQPGFIQGHLDLHRRYPQENMAFLGKVVWPRDLPTNTLMQHIDGIGGQQFSYYYMRPGRAYDFRHFYTCNISLKTVFLKTLGRWFDPGFDLVGYEDVELGYRLARRGMRIVYHDQMVMEHYHYHNVWSFARRQRNSGKMFDVLLRKQPALLAYRPIGSLYGRILKLAAAGAAGKPAATENLAWLENSACRLAAFYEWLPDSLVDSLYTSLFDYFFFAGVIDGLRGGQALHSRLHAAQARRYLIPNLTRFISEAQATGLPLPDGFGPDFLSELSQKIGPIGDKSAL
jgi:glycosyltransferase involved in cell wall biosynthesis